MDDAEVGQYRPTSQCPFEGKQPRECYRLLLQLRTETDSDVDFASFVVLDERSTKDDTVLLVSVDEETEEMRSVRVAFEIAHWLLLGLMDDPLDEDLIRKADEAEDGGLRASDI